MRHSLPTHLKSSFLAVMLALSAGISSPALDLYVSPSGDDGHAGTSDAPFRTLARARDAARDAAPKMTSDIRVWLADGTYVQTQPFTLDARDSGQNFFDIVYEAMPGAHPVISGGRTLTGWELHDAAKNIWQAKADGLATRQLYVHGVRAVRAHTDDKLFTGATQTKTGYTIAGKSPLLDWANIDQVEFVYRYFDGGLPGKGQWVEPRLGVAKVTYASGSTTVTMKEPAYGMEMNAKDTAMIIAGLPSTVENAYELLDQPGEWYLDSRQARIYYLPRPGEDMTQAEVIAPVSETLLSASGTGDAPLHNLQFKGITFAYATWLRPSSEHGFAELQAGHQLDNTTTPAQVVFQHIHHLRLERCVFTHLGAVGLELSQGAQDSTVIGCRFEDISSSGMTLGVMDDPARKSPALRDDNDTIQDCVFTHTGLEYHGAPALICGYVSHALITHNEISHVPYSGISIGWGWGKASYAGDNRVLNNKISDFLEMLGDGGAFYALSAQPNSELAGNLFQHQVNYHNGAAIDGGTIYPDEGSAGWDIHDNVLDHVIRWLNIWTGSIKDIQAHDNWTTTGDILNNGTNIVLANNTVVTGAWPAPAQQIIDRAGLEPAWQDIRRAGQ